MAHRGAKSTTSIWRVIRRGIARKDGRQGGEPAMVARLTCEAIKPHETALNGRGRPEQACLAPAGRRISETGRILVGTAELVRSRVCRTLVSAEAAGGRASALVRATFRNSGSELDFLRRARTCGSLSGGAQATPDEFVFNVKLHRLLSRHAANVRSLPPVLQRLAEADEKGRVALTPGLERALLEQLISSVEPLRAANKFGVFLLQLSPAFSPRKT